MSLKSNFSSYKFGGLVGALLVSTLGLFLHFYDWRLPQILTRDSYDWSFDYLSRFHQPDISGAGVVIIYIDEQSLIDLNQPLDAPMDRSLHATLLNQLKKAGAKAVVMDIVFSDRGTNDAANQKFADAIRDNSNVVLGVDYNPTELKKRLTFPYPLFQQTNAHYGLVVLHPDSDFMIRQHYHHLEGRIEGAPPSLSWTAARMAGVKFAEDPAEQLVERWVNYYGPPGTIPNVSYERAFYGDGVPPGYFRDKVVFIGARPMTAAFIEKRDELRSPYSTPGREYAFQPMVDIHATELLNLMRGDWLRRPSLIVEGLMVLAAGLIFGFGFIYFRPIAATGVALLCGVGVVLFAQNLFAIHHVWFAWLIIVAAQIPVALLYAIIYRSLEWYTQRRKLEEERRKADARIREQAALLDKAGDAIIVHDLNWRAQYWNKSAENLYGWSFAEVEKLNLKTEVFKTDETKLLEALQAALGKGEWSGELKQATKAGKALLVQSRWTLVRDDAGKPKCVLVINTDVTEQKKLESQFLRTQRMESIGTLAGGIAHDLNNVLAPILMGVEMMKMKSTDEFTTKMLSTMSSSAKRGSDMVKQVLTFARGHEGERSLLQISHLVREMQKIVKDTFPKSIDFYTVLGEHLWPILGDATQIHQIILNLCVNARDAMPDGGKITLSAKNAQLSEEEAAKFPGAKAMQYVLLSATDTGTGIPPEIIEKIFEPFFTTKEIGKGTGLGLSTVISIIKSHGGFLDLQTQVGKGTSFNVYLPAAEDALPPTSLPQSPEALRGNGETVMIVDDEPGVLEVTKHVLIHYGYKVVTAIHGADALALYPQYKDKLAVVIMDMMMPVMDGPMAIRELRKQDPQLRVIAISGLMAGDKIQERLGGEGVTFLPKPFATQKLMLTLREVLMAERETTSEAVLTAK